MNGLKIDGRGEMERGFRQGTDWRWRGGWARTTRHGDGIWKGLKRIVAEGMLLLAGPHGVSRACRREEERRRTKSGTGWKADLSSNRDAQQNREDSSKKAFVLCMFFFPFFLMPVTGYFTKVLMSQDFVLAASGEMLPCCLAPSFCSRAGWSRCFRHNISIWSS